VEFLFDRSKDRINRKKHGISLSRASDFDFGAAIFVVDDRKDYGEVRIKAIGFLMRGCMHWFLRRKARISGQSA
jgi:uncharacterized DUF497 family protein